MANVVHSYVVGLQSIKILERGILWISKLYVHKNSIAIAIAEDGQKRGVN
jgi:hypothetical protein